MVYTVRCAHVENRFIVAIEGGWYRFIDFVEDLPDNNLIVEECAALIVPIDEDEFEQEWERARQALLSGRRPAGSIRIL